MYGPEGTGKQITATVHEQRRRAGFESELVPQWPQAVKRRLPFDFRLSACSLGLCCMRTSAYAHLYVHLVASLEGYRVVCDVYAGWRCKTSEVSVLRARRKVDSAWTRGEEAEVEVCRHECLMYRYSVDGRMCLGRFF